MPGLGKPPQGHRLGVDGAAVVLPGALYDAHGRSLNFGEVTDPRSGAGISDIAADGLVYDASGNAYVFTGSTANQWEKVEYGALALAGTAQGEARALAKAKLGSSDIAVVHENELVLAGDVLASGGVPPTLAALSGGVWTVDPGVANAAEAILRNTAASTPIVQNLQTKKWLAYFRLKFSAFSGGAGAIVAGTRIALGLQGTTFYWGLSLDGSQSTTTPKLGKITVATVALSSGTASTVTLAALGNTTYFPFWIYHDGSNVFASLNREADISLFASATLEATTARWAFDNFNAAAKAGADTGLLDFVGIYMVRET